MWLLSVQAWLASQLWGVRWVVLRGCALVVCIRYLFVVPFLIAMVNIVVYNPMCAPYLRLASDAQELANVAIIGLPGTSRRQDNFFGKCRKSGVLNFQHFDWGWNRLHHFHIWRQIKHFFEGTAFQTQR